jgi:hypothetical protein
MPVDLEISTGVEDWPVPTGIELPLAVDWPPLDQVIQINTIRHMLKRLSQTCIAEIAMPPALMQNED